MKIFAPIIKRDDEKRMVYGYASTEALDAQDEKVSKAAIEEALPEYMRFGNIREMHQLSAVGVAKSAEIDEKGLYIQAKIVDDAAWEKVKEGVYKGFSIGGKSLSKVDGTITKMKLTEISVVDRPANPEAVIDAWKADAETPFYKAMIDALEKDAVKDLAALVNAGTAKPTALLEIAKREFSNKESHAAAEKAGAMPDGSFGIKTPIDLKKALRAFVLAKNKKAVKAHIIDRAIILKAVDLLPEGWQTETGDIPNVRKGMWAVSRLADMLDQIASMQACSAWEEQAEGDDSTMPEQLKAWLSEGGKILAAMVDEETAELMGVKGDVEVIAAAATPDDISKGGAKFSAATKEKLAKAHGHMQKAADHMAKAKGAPMGEAADHMDKCDKCIGKANAAMDDVGYKDAEPADKVDAPPPAAVPPVDDVSKAAGFEEAITKAVTAATAPLIAQNSDLQKRLKALEDQPLPAKGPTRVVGKTDDIDSGEGTPATPPAQNVDGSVAKAVDEVKQLHAHGPRMVTMWNSPRRA